MKAIISAAAILLLVGSSAGLAQDSDRYSMEKTEDGFVRMDKRTGEMSTCTERSGQLVCKLAADERRAYQDELQALQERVDGLESRMTKLEAGSTTTPDKSLPSDEEVEKTLGIMERFFRRFMDVAKDLEREFRQEEPTTPPAQDRT